MKEKRGFYWEFTLTRGEYGRSLGLADAHFIVHNALTDEGERNLLDNYFRAQNTPASFWMGLHSGSLAEASTLANVTEPSQLGYARIQLSRNTTDFPTLTQDSGDFQAQTASKTFTALATWTQVNQYFLASTSSGAVGSVILFAELSQAQALVSQDNLTLAPRIKCQ